MHVYADQLRVPLNDAIGQALVTVDGDAIVELGPAGVGSRWYPSAVQVTTSTGPTDLSEVVLYKNIVGPTYIVGQTLQGGGDTIGLTAPMQTGDLLLAVWSGGNPGDLATCQVIGDQVVLTA